MSALSDIKARTASVLKSLKVVGRLRAKQDSDRVVVFSTYINIPCKYLKSHCQPQCICLHHNFDSDK